MVPYGSPLLKNVDGRQSTLVTLRLEVIGLDGRTDGQAVVARWEGSMNRLHVDYIFLVNDVLSVIDIFEVNSILDAQYISDVSGISDIKAQPIMVMQWCGWLVAYTVVVPQSELGQSYAQICAERA